MCKTFFLKSLFIALTIFAVFSCDNDSNEIGADIVGNDNFEVGDPETFTINASNQAIGAVETTDLPVNAIGIYSNPVFGTTKAFVVIQAQLAAVHPAIDPLLNPQIESVVLTIPYFSRKMSTNPAGESIYELDSIYGPANSKIKLKVFESNYFMREIDASSPTQEAQKYYSNQNSEFDALKGIQLNDAAATNQNDQFFFDAAEHSESTTSATGVVTIVRTAPGIKLDLNKAFFKTKIIDAPEVKLLNNNIFKEYFRGLYFSVESSGADGNLAMLNFKEGKITIKYKEYESVPVVGEPIPNTVDKTIILNLNGKSANFYESTPVTVANADRLNVKGGEGSMAVIDLFGRTATTALSQELENLRAKKWLVNDASITFQIDDIAMGTTAEEPKRIYLYDLDNKRPLIDYYTDINSPSSNVKNSKSVFGGIIKTKNHRGTEYKFKMTNYIRGLLKNSDSTNVRLGLVVTEAITDISNKKLKNPITNPVIKEIPRATVMNQLGTILYGSGSGVDEDKRLKFKIYFTKPKQN